MKQLKMGNNVLRRLVCDMCLFLTIFQATAATNVHVRYSVHGENVTYEDARNLCRLKHGGTMAEFKGDQDSNLNILITTVELPSYARFWVNDTESYLMTSTCAYLSTEHNPSRCDFTVANCSLKLGYICQILPTSSGAIDYTDGTSTTLQSSGAMAMFSSSSVYKASYNSEKGLPSESTESYTPTPRNTTNPKAMIDTQVTNHIKETSTHKNILSHPDNLSHVIHNTLASNCTQICCASYKFYCHNTIKENGKNLSHIIHEMEVNKRTTSRHLRRLSSAKDYRTSSKTMGIVAMLIIGTIFACVVAMDIPILVSYIKNA